MSRPPAAASLTLHLLRHAKSSWGQPELGDAERPLAPRGERAARKLARELRRQGIAPRLVLCSAARRARETLDLLRPALPAGVEILVEEGLYGAGPAELMQRLRGLPGGHGEVMLVGHNPALHELALALAGDTAPEPLRAGLPAGALVSLRFGATSWARIAAGKGMVARLLLPRDL